MIVDQTDLEFDEINRLHRFADVHIIVSMLWNVTYMTQTFEATAFLQWLII